LVSNELAELVLNNLPTNFFFVKKLPTNLNADDRLVLGTTC